MIWTGTMTVAFTASLIGLLATGLTALPAARPLMSIPLGLTGAVARVLFTTVTCSILPGNIYAPKLVASRSGVGFIRSLPLEASSALRAPIEVCPHLGTAITAEGFGRHHEDGRGGRDPYISA